MFFINYRITQQRYCATILIRSKSNFSDIIIFEFGDAIVEISINNLQLFLCCSITTIIISVRIPTGICQTINLTIVYSSTTNNKISFSSNSVTNNSMRINYAITCSQGNTITYSNFVKTNFS